ncbi:hypothetical protein [Streptomyces sp. HUAS TT7]|uniref:hypothetical protein n=1 Tax=Streptomyces sp. HUAS TT7 TaxID=3447507 RepID=UPI003F657479
MAAPGRGPRPTGSAAPHQPPHPGTVPRHRVDVTDSGLVIEFEERWEDGGASWYCREKLRAEVRDGVMSEVSVYCTGDWSPAVQDAHTKGVTLPRP